MDATWIVSANAGRAKFFSQANAAAPLEEITDMVNSAARLREADLQSDEMGQRAASKSRHSVGAPTQPSGYEPNQSSGEHQTELFARDVANFLQQGQHESRFRQIYLVASPEFLGMLRKQLDPNLESAIGLEINKDYTQFTAEELRAQIETHGGKGKAH